MHCIRPAWQGACHCSMQAADEFLSATRTIRQRLTAKRPTRTGVSPKVRWISMPADQRPARSTGGARASGSLHPASAPAMRSMKRSSAASATLSSTAKVSGRTTFSVCGTRSTVSGNTLSVDSPRRYSRPGCEAARRCRVIAVTRPANRQPHSQSRSGSRRAVFAGNPYLARADRHVDRAATLHRTGARLHS